MATTCGKINANIKKDCNIPLQMGTRDLAKIINLSDIVSVVYDSTNKAQVKDIVLKTGATAFEIDGFKNSIRPLAGLEDGTYSKRFNHSVEVLGFDISIDTKEQLNAGIEGRYVVITENYFQGDEGQSAFEVYGLTVGMELTAVDKNPNDAETQGAFHLMFSTPLNKEPKLPNAFFDTDYATTKAIFDAL
jgi:hypothetical protein